MPSVANGSRTVHDRQHIRYGIRAPPAACSAWPLAEQRHGSPRRPVVRRGISQVLAGAARLGLQHGEWIKCSAHVLHGASLLQFQDMINSAAEGHLSWRIQLGKKGKEDHSDIRGLIGELLGPPSNEALRSSTVTSPAPGFILFLKSPSKEAVIAERRSLDFFFFFLPD